MSAYIKSSTLRTFSYYLVMIGILIFVSVNQFVDTYRSKFPYSSDTLFYKHIFYQFKGDTFEEARRKVLLINSAIDWKSNAEKNIFDNRDAYVDTYYFFGNRILYPFLAYSTNFYLDEETAFLIPVFLPYLGTIVLIFGFIRKKLGKVLSLIALVLLVRFPLYASSMAMLMTDSLGLFLFFAEIGLVLKFVQRGTLKTFILLLFVFILSFFNREPAVIFVVGVIIAFLIYGKSTNRYPWSKGRGSLIFTQDSLLGPQSSHTRRGPHGTAYSQDKPRGFFAQNEFEEKNFKIVILSLLLLGIFIYLTAIIMGGPTLLDSYQRIQNNWGLTHNYYNFMQTINFLKTWIVDLHLFIAGLIMHVWYFALFFIIGILFCLYKAVTKRLDLFESLLTGLSAGVYFQMLIFPNFAYRYFLMIMILCVYFTVLFIKELIKKLKLGQILHVFLKDVGS